MSQAHGMRMGGQDRLFLGLGAADREPYRSRLKKLGERRAFRLVALQGIGGILDAPGDLDGKAVPGDALESCGGGVVLRQNPVEARQERPGHPRAERAQPVSLRRQPHIDKKRRNTAVPDLDDHRGRQRGTGKDEKIRAPMVEKGAKYRKAIVRRGVEQRPHREICGVQRLGAIRSDKECQPFPGR